MWKSNKVASLLDKKQKINKEIEKIQENCKHIAKSIKLVRKNGDSSPPVIRWVCNGCLLAIGYPSEKEEYKFFRE